MYKVENKTQCECNEYHVVPPGQLFFETRGIQHIIGKFRQYDGTDTCDDVTRPCQIGATWIDFAIGAIWVAFGDDVVFNGMDDDENQEKDDNQQFSLVRY